MALRTLGRLAMAATALTAPLALAANPAVTVSAATTLGGGPTLGQITLGTPFDQGFAGLVTVDGPIAGAQPGVDALPVLSLTGTSSGTGLFSATDTGTAVGSLSSGATGEVACASLTGTYTRVSQALDVTVSGECSVHGSAVILTFTTTLTMTQWVFFPYLVAVGTTLVSGA